MKANGEWIAFSFLLLFSSSIAYLPISLCYSFLNRSKQKQNIFPEMNTRNELALSIIDFLKSEKESGRLGEDGTEALEGKNNFLL